MPGYLIAWIVQGLLIALLPIAAVLVHWRRHADSNERARFAKRVGGLYVGAIAVLLGLFLAGEALSDPGGWRGLALVASWFVPVACIGLLAWYKPAWGRPFVEASTVAAIGLSVWAALDPTIRELEDLHGPFVFVACYVAAVVAAALGHARPREAGILLLLLGVIPAAVTTLPVGGSAPGRIAFYVLAVPLVTAGVLYLVSGTRSVATTSLVGLGGKSPT